MVFTKSNLHIIAENIWITFRNCKIDARDVVVHNTNDSAVGYSAENGNAGHAPNFSTSTNNWKKSFLSNQNYIYSQRLHRAVGPQNIKWVYLKTIFFAENISTVNHFEKLPNL